MTTNYEYGRQAQRNYARSPTTPYGYRRPERRGVCYIPGDLPEPCGSAPGEATVALDRSSGHWSSGHGHLSFGNLVGHDW